MIDEYATTNRTISFQERDKSSARYVIFEMAFWIFGTSIGRMGYRQVRIVRNLTRPNRPTTSDPLRSLWAHYFSHFTQTNYSESEKAIVQAIELAKVQNEAFAVLFYQLFSIQPVVIGNPANKQVDKTLEKNRRRCRRARLGERECLAPQQGRNQRQGR